MKGNYLSNLSHKKTKKKQQRGVDYLSLFTHLSSFYRKSIALVAAHIFSGFDTSFYATYMHKK